MKSYLTHIFLLVFLICGLVFPKEILADSTFERVIKNGYLQVSMTKLDHPPFFMKNERGELIGVDVEIAKAMAEKLGVDVRFNRDANSFNEVIDIVSKGNADIGISKLSYTLERAKLVLYSNPYIKLRKALLINRIQYAKIKAKRKATTLHELAAHEDFTVGVVSKSSYENFAKSLFPNSDVKSFVLWNEQVLKGVSEGALLAAFRDELEIKKFLLLEPNANLNVLAIILKDQDDPIQMVMRADDNHFKDWVNGFLSTAKIELNVDGILNKYKPYLDQD